MKLKVYGKKLSLSKMTLANLDMEEKRCIQAGYVPPDETSGVITCDGCNTEPYAMCPVTEHCSQLICW